MDKLIFRKSGFVAQTWNSEKESYDEASLPLDHRFFSAWYESLTIETTEGEVTFGDLVAVFQKMPEETRRVVSALLWKDIENRLARYRKHSSTQENRIDNLVAVEVTREFCVDNRVDLDVEDLQDVEDSHGVDAAGNTHWGLLGLEWEEVAHLPVRIARQSALVTTRWRKRDEPVSVFDDSSEFMSYKEHDGDFIVKEVRVSMRLGDFLRGLLTDL